MKRNLITLAVFSFVVFLIWYAGIDMLARGGMQAATLFMAAMCATWVYFYPGWNK